MRAFLGDIGDSHPHRVLWRPPSLPAHTLGHDFSTSTADRDLKTEAMRAAWTSRSLFRAPTSEGLLRNVYQPAVPGGHVEYWRRVLAYALEGGISDVLDEFFHVIRESLAAETGASALVDALCQALRLAAVSLDVSEWESGTTGVRRKMFPMRQHFARRYANDGFSGSDQQASKHLDVVRAAFDSPLWPFVLGTTSVGQEGLDFH